MYNVGKGCVVAIVVGLVVHVSVEVFLETEEVRVRRTYMEVDDHSRMAV